MIILKNIFEKHPLRARYILPHGIVCKILEPRNCSNAQTLFKGSTYTRNHPYSLFPLFPFPIPYYSLFPFPLFPILPCSLPFPIPYLLFSVSYSLFSYPLLFSVLYYSLFPIPSILYLVFRIPCSLFLVFCYLFPILLCSLFYPDPTPNPYSCVRALYYYPLHIQYYSHTLFACYSLLCPCFVHTAAVRPYVIPTSRAREWPI